MTRNSHGRETHPWWLASHTRKGATHNPTNVPFNGNHTANLPHARTCSNRWPHHPGTDRFLLPTLGIHGWKNETPHLGSASKHTPGKEREAQDTHKEMLHSTTLFFSLHHTLLKSRPTTKDHGCSPPTPHPHLLISKKFILVAIYLSTAVPPGHPKTTDLIRHVNANHIRTASSSYKMDTWLAIIH